MAKSRPDKYGLPELRSILRELRQIRRASEKVVERVHIFPLAEKGHRLRYRLCWCSPSFRLADDGETEIVVHQRAN